MRVGWGFFLLVAIGEAIGGDNCADFEDAAIKKLCRKVESQEKYLEKMVENQFKAETVFRWYSANKEWLTHPRLPRMMKRLLRRAATLNPSESDDFSDDSSSSSGSSGTIGPVMSVELEQRLESLEQKTEAMEKRIIQSVNASLQAQQDQWWSAQANQTNQSLQHVMAGSSELALRVSKAEKMLQTAVTIKTALGNSNRSRPAAVDEDGVAIPSPTGAMGDEMMRLKHSLENEMEQLMLKMQLTASDLERSINTVQMSSEAALRNFSQSYKDGMSQLSALLDERLSTASSSSYDVITNATVAFGEDVQLLRQAVFSSASQIQFLVGQDLKSTRGLEELRTGNRRHEGHIQQLTNQLADFKNQVQDQLNSIRTHFTQTVNEFYNKIVERQNGMQYRLSSVVDDLIGVKNRVRNLPGPTSTAGGADQTSSSDDEEADRLKVPDLD